ncbi:MAG: sulfatase-like hydrolase/transferase [Planctomycetota bacterium]
MKRSEPNNILLVVTDQQRFDTIAALGNKIIRTPALDALAEQGAAFTHAYTPSPVCVAARSALLTGLPPHVTGCVDNMPMSRPGVSLMQRLRLQGYQTHGVGKMHFPAERPDTYEFDTRDVSEEEVVPALDDYAKYLAEQGFGHVSSPHGMRSEMYYVPQPSQLPARHHHNAWTVDRSIDFLERRDRSRPFFLMTSFIKPHPPFESPTPWNTLYRGPEMPRPRKPAWARDTWTYWNRVQNRYKQHDPGPHARLERTRAAAYYGCISHLDFELGRLLDTLNQLAQNTVVIFTSDHGELLGDFGCVGKRSMHDASCRVPMIVRWPDGRHAGARIGIPTTLLDIVPTCLASAGVESPQVHAEGSDLSEIAERGDPRRVVYSQFQRGRYALYMAATRHEKFVHSAPDDRSWVFRTATAGAPEELLIDNTAKQVGQRLDLQLRRRFTSDSYTHAVESGHWVAYEKPEADFTSPDAGLFFQDPVTQEDEISTLPPAYQRPIPEGFDITQSYLSSPDPFVRRRAKVPAPVLLDVVTTAKAKAPLPLLGKKPQL